MKATKIPDATKVLLMDRCDGFCERCGIYAGLDPHHRLKKGMGGTRDPQMHDLTNLLALCRECHRWVEHEGAISGESYDNGWLVKRIKDRGPEVIPVTYRDREAPQLLHAEPDEDGRWMHDATGTPEKDVGLISDLFGLGFMGEAS